MSNLFFFCAKPSLLRNFTLLYSLQVIVHLLAGTMGSRKFLSGLEGRVLGAEIYTKVSGQINVNVNVYAYSLISHRVQQTLQFRAEN